MIFSRIALGIMLIMTQLLNAQIANKYNNCAEKFARRYFFKMGITDSIQSQEMPLLFTEVLSGKEIETEFTGVFIVSNLNAHRRKLILLKNGEQLKLLTFGNVYNSLHELISFLNDIKANDKDLFKYIDFIQEYIESSKGKIKVPNKLDDSNWIKCE